MNYGGNGKEQLKLTVGRICQSVLDAAWSVLITVKTVEGLVYETGVSKPLKMRACMLGKALEKLPSPSEESLLGMTPSPPCNI